ncbi:MAG: hypothetical protein PHQ09_05920 [Actinomycetota bacterium]|nr:hypothetical protein [Actinomycetota bacterium]
MMDLKKLAKLPIVTRRMYILDNICKLKNVDLEYLFGLLNLYNKKNSGKWFWEKAVFTGALKTDYDNFNIAVDEIVRDIRNYDEKKTEEQVKSASENFDKLLIGLEVNCNTDRKKDYDTVKGFLDKNLKMLITDNLKRLNSVSLS